MLLHGDTVTIDAFADATGWAVKPEGACKGDLCVPLPSQARQGDALDVATVAERLGMPVLTDALHGVTALGPATVAGRALETATAPPLTLPDADGNPFDLASLHGRKVLLVAWASW